MLYLEESKKSLPWNILVALGSWFISFSNFIPISLLVSVEMVRWGQGSLLFRDDLCKGNGFPLEVQTSSVNEELGQIKYILSDKTGTLTQNVMNFKCLYVEGVKYGRMPNEGQRVLV